MVSAGGIYRTLFIVTMILIVSVSPAAAQEVPGPALSGVGEIPPEYEQTVRDLVERYEQMRAMLREQIRRNTELFSQQEIDTATAELDAEVERLESENASLRRDYKALIAETKLARQYASAFKDELVKTRATLSGEIGSLEHALASIEEETLLNIGGTFSPAGRVGAFGQINLPGTNVGLIVEGIYDLREREATTAFGVSFGLLPHSSIVEAFRRNRPQSPRSQTEPEDTANGTETEDDTTDLSSDEETAPGTLFRPRSPDTP